jgi:autotransporter-associated beta strand protein
MHVKNSIGRKASTNSHFSTSRKKSVAALAAAAGFGLMAAAAHADVLLWNASNNTSWDGVSTNWDDLTSSANPVAYADTTGGNPTAVQFNDSNGGAVATPATVVIGNVTGGTPNGVSPASVTFVDNGGTTGSYTFSAATGDTLGIQGAATLTLNASYSGTVYLDEVNTFTGLTTVNGGTLQLTNQGNDSLGTGGIVLGGGNIALNHSVTIPNNITATASTTSGLIANGSGDNVTETGTISGSGTLNLSGGETWSVDPATATNLLSGFSGTIAYGANTGFFRFQNFGVNDPLGSSSAVFSLGTSTGEVTQSGATGVALLGALSGGASTLAAGPGHSGNNQNNQGEFVIGGAGLNTTFAGTITQGSERQVIDITGGGSLTLSNANTYSSKANTLPSYQGPGTTILGNGQAASGNAVGTSSASFTGMPTSSGGGALYVSNTTGSATGVSPVFVEGASSASGAGGLLGGDGIVQGDVSTAINGENNAVNSATPLANFAAGGIIAPGKAGTNSSVTLTLSGGLQLGDWSNLEFSLDTAPATAADDLIAVSNTTDSALATALTLPDDSNINVNFSFPNGAPALNAAYNLITYTGTDSYGGGTSALLAGWSSTGVPVGDNVTFNDTGSAITATFTAVPEPASIGLLGVGVLGLLRRRRNRA